MVLIHVIVKSNEFMGSKMDQCQGRVTVHHHYNEQYISSFILTNPSEVEGNERSSSNPRIYNQFKWGAGQLNYVAFFLKEICASILRKRSIPV